MAKALPIGVSDFRDIISNDGYYVDKTLLIADWLQTMNGNVTLITRPRRFGKTLNMTMLREFFDIAKDSKGLFQNLAISTTEYVQEINKWPVIFLSMKDCKGSYDQVMTCLYKTLLHVFKPILSQDHAPLDAKLLKKMVDTMTSFDFEHKAIIEDAIYFLCQLLYKTYGKKVIILIDEYDTPMLNAYEQGYYNDLRFFFGSLYGSALKDNPYLERAMLTGIHRIAKESIFSGLNNLSVCTVLTERYQQYFGLTPEETRDLLAAYGLPFDATIRAMYDGYLFGQQEIYNPWSIINYADVKRLEPFWANTATNEILVRAMLSSDRSVQADLEQLVVQGQVRVPVDLQTSFFELAQPATLWGLFINSGYLTVTRQPEVNDLLIEIRIPNQEVMISFRKIIERFGGFAPNSLETLFDALLHKDIGRFRRIYEQIILTCTSFHDGSAENAYHMLFLGMCVYLNGEYRVSSNMESGHGRADILLEARHSGRPNFVIEFKQGDNLEQLAQEALAQIHEKKYYTGLTGETILLGIAHDLKQCHVMREIVTL